MFLKNKMSTFANVLVALAFVSIKALKSADADLQLDVFCSYLKD